MEMSRDAYASVPQTECNRKGKIKSMRTHVKKNAKRINCCCSQTWANLMWILSRFSASNASIKQIDAQEQKGAHRIANENERASWKKTRATRKLWCRKPFNGKFTRWNLFRRFQQWILLLQYMFKFSQVVLWVQTASNRAISQHSHRRCWQRHFAYGWH